MASEMVSSRDDGSSARTITPMSYSERNIPQPRPAGPKIPVGVRSSILSIVAGEGVSPTWMWQAFLRHWGYRMWQEIIDDIRERMGDEQAAEFQTPIAVALQKDKDRWYAAPGKDYLAEPALLALPEPMFLDAVEFGLKHIGPYAGGNPLVKEINALFARRGIYLRFDDWGNASWVGDPGNYGMVIEPALAALGDARLQGARGEFEAALRHLRGGSHKDLEDAIEEAGKSVESVMKVLLDEKGVTRSGRDTAFPLFDLLRDNAIVEAEADHAVLAAARIRNQWGGHGSGAAQRQPPLDLADLAVRSAASAIVLLAGRLP